MPVGGLLWVELISRVTSFRHPCSTELDTVSKAADQQDTKCSNHTHTHTHTDMVINTDRQIETQTQTDKCVDRQADRHINTLREWQKHYFSC